MCINSNACIQGSSFVTDTSNIYVAFESREERSRVRYFSFEDKEYFVSDEWDTLCIEWKKLKE